MSYAKLFADRTRNGGRGLPAVKRKCYVVWIKCIVITFWTCEDSSYVTNLC